MLRIIVPLTEGYDEKNEKFVTTEGFVLDLEHSLVSLSKWESKWKKPFLSQEQMTPEQTQDYIRMMILGEIPPGEILIRLSPDNIKEIVSYIEDKMTATWFSDREPANKNREIITAEIIYYWMISLGIPFECQYWHLNRLLTLIRVCNAKNAPKKKMSKTEALAWQRSLNEERRRQTGSRG